MAQAPSESWRSKFRLSLTVALIAICVIVALISKLGAVRAPLLPLLFTYTGGGEEILSGEIWRLITPIFIHFGALHLLFNMMWLWDLGNLLEGRRGLWFFGGFVLLVGIASNIAQHLLGGPSFFGGMSGVVYGLLGYIWMQGRYNPRFGYMLHKHIVIMMLIWFVLCWTGLLGPIANWAHTGGLIIGVVWGYLEKNKRFSSLEE